MERLLYGMGKFGVYRRYRLDSREEYGNKKSPRVELGADIGTAENWCQRRNVGNKTGASSYKELSKMSYTPENNTHLRFVGLKNGDWHLPLRRLGF